MGDPFKDMDREAILQAAWKALAHNPNLEHGFPRGFWPDLAAVAVEMTLQRTLDPVLNFRPTRSGDIFSYANKKPIKRMSSQLEEVKPLRIVEEDDTDNPFARMQRKKRDR